MAQYDGAENGLRVIPGCPTLPMANGEHRSSAGRVSNTSVAQGTTLPGAEFMS